MKNFDDETLMAYVDGELNEQESANVELALTSDPQALEKVERFRKTRTAIDQFADILSEPIPEHLIETIRHHEQVSDPIKFPERAFGGNWMKLAASIVIGISLGTIGTQFYLNQYHEKETAIAASKMASLEKALEAERAEKEIARVTAATAENNIAGLVRDLEGAVAEKDAAVRKAATAETKFADISKALEVAEEAKKAALAKAATSEAAREKMAGIKDLGEIFPLHLVDEALKNGSDVSADLQKNILANLKADTLPVTAASDTSERTFEQTETVPLASAVEMGNSKDLQPEKPLNILGEFSIADKTCRLFEYDGQRLSKKLVLVACKIGTEDWEIVRR